MTLLQKKNNNNKLLQLTINLYRVRLHLPKQLHNNNNNNNKHYKIFNELVIVIFSLYGDISNQIHCLFAEETSTYVCQHCQ